MTKTRLVFSSVRTDRQPGALAAILRVSRTNNPRDGVTGVLLSGRDRFVQLLEGNRAGIARCFARIRQDSRHRDVSVLVSERTSETLFPNTAMQSVEADATDPLVAAALRRQASPKEVMEVFRSLAGVSGPPPGALSGAGEELLVLRRIHLAARQVIDDHLARPHHRPETLVRLRASLARQAAHARALHQRLATATPADPEHCLEALELCEFLEDSERRLARYLDGQG